jgi:aryl-alcohol dehydrogenase-like predicted oxidoreductase
MQTRPLGSTGFDIAPLVFGGNVFGWTANEAESFRLLDAFVDAGLNAIDTADAYSTWVPGNSGGESETIIGNWLARDPGKRERIVLITKVGSDMGQGHVDLSEKWVMEAVENSLRRLQIEAIDVYLSHWPDPRTPHAETLGAYQKLLDQGKIRSIGASNLDATQLAEALKVADETGLPRYRVLQPGYNLLDRKTLPGREPRRHHLFLARQGLPLGQVPQRGRPREERPRRRREGLSDAAGFLDPRRPRRDRCPDRRHPGRDLACMDRRTAGHHRADRERDQPRPAREPCAGGRTHPLARRCRAPDQGERLTHTSRPRTTPGPE